MEISQALLLGRIDPFDRSLLLAKAIAKDRTFVLAHPQYRLTKEEIAQYTEFITRRANHEPIAYILGEKEFFGLSFLVNQSTLIPRPETELLVEHVIQYIEKNKSEDTQGKKIAIIDIGTGSGCIIISIANYLQSSLEDNLSSISFFATDISNEALEVAQKNAAHHHVDTSIFFSCSDLISSLEERLRSFDTLLVTANLPYLSEALYQDTVPDVQNFEPASALVSGTDGLDHYRKLLTSLSSLANTKKVTFWLEISPEQEPLLPALLKNVPLKKWKCLPDLSGKIRLVTGSW